MPSQVTNYKCPACGGPLHFVGASGRLECDYCGSSFDVKQVEEAMAQKEAQASDAFQEAEAKQAQAQTPEGWDLSDLGSDWGADAAGMKAYNCPSCGAELICDQNTAATSCPYCGNPTVVPGQFAGTLKPDLVIPFKLDKKAAEEALKKHYKGRPFLPGKFTSQNHIEEIKGIYVPFWLFDAQVDGDVSYDASTSTTHREGDYEVTTTRHYRVRRSGTAGFEKIPADGSSKMPDDYMDSIEPFDYGELKGFSTAYLPGFLADRYDVTAQDCAERSDKRCENSMLDLLRNSVNGYDSVTATSQSVNIHRGKVHYALFPVWMLNTKWGGKDFLFAMNGQTGKMVGNLPVSWVKFWATFLGLSVGLSALTAALFMFLL
ncbi:MAG: hypothetical protein IJT94_07770 [Oscillibacter sp.]|nr:hypothetical protein [Oscillibacter sp.]